MTTQAQTRRMIQLGIARQLGVVSHFRADEQTDSRINFLENYLVQSGAQAYVLGVSGGIDSTTAATMAQAAVRNARRGPRPPYKFVAVRLPYGVQKDEDDAQAALAHIDPDLIETVDIKPAVDAIMDAMDTKHLTDAQYDFVKGNVKARQRMVVQYALAGKYNGLVIGTDHASEAVMGFFTKHGDGAADVVPLAGATKEDVRNMAIQLNVPANLVQKPPTADLEDLRPGLLDEVAYGVSYADIGQFLRGEEVSDHVFDTIVQQYNKTQHKRELAVAP